MARAMTVTVGSSLRSRRGLAARGAKPSRRAVSGLRCTKCRCRVKFTACCSILRPIFLIQRMKKSSTLGKMTRIVSHLLLQLVLSELMFALLHLRCTYRSLQCARQFSVASDISPTRNKRSRFEAQTSRVAFAISRLLMLQTGDRHYV